MYRLLLLIPVAIIPSCKLLKKSSSQCDDEFVRQSVIDKIRSSTQSTLSADSIDIHMGESDTIEAKGGEHKCQADVEMKAAKINYKSKSTAELGK